MYHLIHEMNTFIDICEYIGLLYIIGSIIFSTRCLIFGLPASRIIGNCNKCKRSIVCPPKPLCEECADKGNEITKID
jgi:hypothetical protein